MLIAEITKDKGTVHLRDTKQHSTLKTISHTKFWWTVHICYIFSLLPYFWRSYSSLYVFVLLFLLKMSASFIHWMGSWVPETARPLPLGWERLKQDRNQYNRVEKMKNGGFTNLIWWFFYLSIFPSDDLNPLTFIPSWKCYPETGKVGEKVQYTPCILYL